MNLVQFIIEYMPAFLFGIVPLVLILIAFPSPVQRGIAFIYIAAFIILLGGLVIKPYEKAFGNVKKENVIYGEDFIKFADEIKAKTVEAAVGATALVYSTAGFFGNFPQIKKHREHNESETLHGKID